MLAQKIIGFIGSGNMATALIGGLIADGHPPQQIIASDPDAVKGQALADRYAIQSTQDNQLAVNTCDVLVLAVKPQVMQKVLEPLKDLIQQQQPLLISIAAGIRTGALQNWLGGHLPLVRCMPNTPALVQAGATGLYATQEVSGEQKQLAQAILATAGIVEWLDNEADLDVVTAISGSGPAYFFLLLEAMEQAAWELGLDAKTARQLSAQTALGAARMVLQGADDPATLRAKVTSPGGTTERAIQSMQQDKFEEMIARAIRAARDRAVELSNDFKCIDKEIFDQYNGEESHVFDRVVVPVIQAKLEKENLVSRSQAKRLLTRIENFKYVVFDFTDVDSIGQAFADAIFRVFQLKYPGVSINYQNACPDVEKMIKRAKAG